MRWQDFRKLEESILKRENEQMSFLSVLKNIGNDIEAGILLAAPIVGDFVPQYSPILTEIAEIIADLEGPSAAGVASALATGAAGPVPTDAAMSQIVRAIAATSTISQHKAAKP